MPICKICKEEFPNYIRGKDGRLKNIHTRKYCPKCNPDGKKGRFKVELENNIGNKAHKKCISCGITLTEKTGYKRSHRFRKKCRKCLAFDVNMNTFKKKKLAVERLGGKCTKCNEDRIPILQFHHLRNKDASWSGIKNRSIEVIFKEIDKCILLCNNCHTLEHSTFYNEHILKS